MLWLIDNFDSFTHNIANAVETLGEPVEVLNSARQIPLTHPSFLIIGPGPGRPEEAAFALKMLDQWKGKIPILGICLGHQCIAHYFGAHVQRALYPMHGKSSPICHDQKGLFTSLPNPLSVARYHSLVIDAVSIPDSLAATAWTENGEIMGIRHLSLPVEGVQFHPDSILTEQGELIFANFLRGIRCI